jgi:hypothetical protein
LTGATTGAGGTNADGGAFVGSLLSARIRRLTNAEFDATAHALLGTSQTFAATFAPDVRQGSFVAGGFQVAGFTRNAAAIFDTVSTPLVQAAANSLASEAVANHLSTLAPCSDPNTKNCATTFINTFGAQAFRRPVTSDELSGLLGVFQAGLQDQSYAGGIQLVISTILQSAGFLYLTELGGTASNGVTALTSYEVASELSYFLTGGPPDAALLQAAARDTLRDPGTVATQATRLMSTANASRQIAAFVEQWLGIDTPPGTTTGVLVSGAEMVNETTAVVSDVMTNGDGTLSSLLTAPFTYVDANLAKLYGLPSPAGAASSKVQLGGQRVGLLNEASFLNTYSHSTFSAPVKRGHVVRTQMLCNTIPPPDPSLKVNTTPPLPTTAQTTRQADADHMTNAVCAGCHQLMDPIGWGFENFDGDGAYRTTEASQPIDSSGVLNAAGALTGPFANGAALIQALAASPDVENCYFKKFGDFASAMTDPGIEATFLHFWQSQPASTLHSLPKILVAFVQTDLFLKRSVTQ